MSFARTLIAAFLFFAWMPATSSCLLAAAFPASIPDCCVNEGGDDGSTCDKCVKLENSLPLAPLQTRAPAAPLFAEVAWLSEMLRAMSREVSDEPRRAATGDSPPAVRLWIFVARTALPVRGPSFAV